MASEFYSDGIGLIALVNFNVFNVQFPTLLGYNSAAYIITEEVIDTFQGNFEIRDIPP